MRPASSLFLILSLWFGSTGIAARASAPQFCLKSNRLVDAPALVSDMEISGFNRLLVQVTSKNQKTQLLMRAQMKEKGDFWTYSQTLLSSNIFAGTFDSQRALHVFSSPNTSQIKWERRFSLVKKGAGYLIFFRNRSTPYSFQRAPVQECESIVF